MSTASTIGSVHTNPVYMDPAKIARQLVEPLYAELARIRTEAPHARRQQGIETSAARHRVRSEASKRAWVTIRANREKAKRRERRAS
jgi:hypothetical protein